MNPPPIKILFFSAASSYGGGERYLITLLPLLEAMGHSVALTCLNPNVFSEIRRYIVSRFSVEKFDAVVFNGNGALYKWSRATILHGVKSVFVMHTSLYDTQERFYKRMLRPALLKWYSRRLDLIIRVSESCLPNSYHNNIVTIHNGVLLGVESTSQRVDFGVLKLVMVGALNSNKNQILAIKSLLELPGNVMLTLIGTGPLQDDLKRIVKQYSLEKRVTFLGFRNNPVSILGEYHCLLITSKIEAFPFVALEAMSVGVPVISANVGGIGELIQDGINGLLFDIDHIDEFISKIRIIYEMEGRRKIIGKNAWLTISNKFTADSMAKNFIAEFNKIL